MKFTIDRNNKIIIYGAGKLGEKYYKLFTAFFRVAAYLDVQAKNQDEFPVPVYCPETKQALELRNYPVFISFHDCSQHNAIAEGLWKLGYNKILFFPMQTCGGGHSIVKMRQVYRMLVEQEFKKQKDIPCYDEFLTNYKKEEVIRKSNRYIVVYVSYELLYTSIIDPDIQNKSLLKYSDVPMLAHNAYLGLFQYLCNGEYTEGAEEYKKIYGERQEYPFTKDHIFKNRYNLFMSLVADESFDIEDAPLEVQWNENGYFNIQDGQHRAIYYYLRQMRRIPVRISKDDYQKLYNKKAVASLLQFLEKNKISKVYTPIPYFGLYQFPSYRENQVRTVLGYIQRFLHGKKFSKVIDLSVYHSYFGRNMVRMKIPKVDSVEVNQRDYELSLHLNQLLKTDACNVILHKNRYDFEEEYDLAFVLGSLVEGEQRERCLQQLDRMVNDMIIWESINHPEEEKCYIMENSKFIHYILLGRFYVERQVKEVGVFLASNYSQEDRDYER